MTAGDLKADLHRYLQDGRDALVSKLDGQSEYDVRRPLTATGTNLLGLVKHLACVELGYFGAVFGRPAPVPVPWDEPDAEVNADMWATPDESRAFVLGLYATARSHADATITELALDAHGQVPWWRVPEVTLGHVLVHVVAETHRHAGHADIVRELVDGSAGLSSPGDNLPEQSPQDWAAYRERLERAAQEAQQRSR